MNIKKTFLLSIILMSMSVMLFAQSVVQNNNPDTTNHQRPFLIVDGFPFPGDITDLNPAYIDSVNVIKSNVAMSLWGLAGRNGVVFVTNKAGHKFTFLNTAWDLLNMEYGNPTYVVDGVLIDSQRSKFFINNLDPHKIIDMQILKYKNEAGINPQRTTILIRTKATK